jgi:anti-sigma B factor antagonist
MALTVRTEREMKTGATARVYVSGRLDTSTASQLEADVVPLLTGPTRVLVFDLEALEFITSAGLRVLLAARKEIAGRGGSVVFVNMQPQIARVAEIVKALPDLRIFKDAAELDAYLATMQRKVVEGED